MLNKPHQYQFTSSSQSQL